VNNNARTRTVLKMARDKEEEEVEEEEDPLVLCFIQFPRANAI
jgi:hypothetical protein|tara:strand:- start:122 stop:250 length:129 start_codon:yes stop_codon:yes gene_type:complete